MTPSSDDRRTDSPLKRWWRGNSWVFVALMGAAYATDPDPKRAALWHLAGLFVALVARVPPQISRMVTQNTGNPMSKPDV